MGLTKQEEETIYLIAEKITGTSQQGVFRKDILVRNVERRMVEVNTRSLADYLQLVNSDPLQYQNLVSDLTIHTTSWFREKPHYDLLKQQAADLFKTAKRPFKVWSSACSTGEEVYSAALVLEGLREHLQGFEYEIHGSDIDIVSVDKAQRALYEAAG
ncbi:MAG TPA: CheR family methyltransferase, partial [Pseudobdellovibrionaceae bacterium]